MISIRKYQLKEDANGRYHVKCYEIIPCPVCSDELNVIGTRYRKLTDNKDKKIIIVIRRMRCKGCKIIHHELPDIIVPYKRICAETIEKIIDNKSEEIPCETRTIHRIRAWWVTFTEYFRNIQISIIIKYGVEFSKGPAPKEIIRAVVNTHLWIHTRTAYLTG